MSFVNRYLAQCSFVTKMLLITTPHLFVDRISSGAPYMVWHSPCSTSILACLCCTDELAAGPNRFEIENLVWHKGGQRRHHKRY